MAATLISFERIQDVPWLVYRARIFYEDTAILGDTTIIRMPFQESALTATGTGPLPPGSRGDTDMRWSAAIRTDWQSPTPGVDTEIQMTINGAGTPADPFVIEAECNLTPTVDIVGNAIYDYYFVWFQQAELGTQTFNVGV